MKMRLTYDKAGRTRCSFEKLEDRRLLDCTGADFCVSNTNSNGPGSLQAAIDAANLDPHPERVEQVRFDIPGEGNHVISPQNVLELKTPISIVAEKRNDSIVVEINGQHQMRTGPVIHSDGNTISGLRIKDFGMSGIVILGDNNVIVDNEISTNEHGIRVIGGVGNYIGQDSSGVGRGNQFMNNAVRVISIEYDPGDSKLAAKNVISNNIIEGSSEGVSIPGGRDNRIESNMISGAVSAGIYIGNRNPSVVPRSSANIVVGNDISNNNIGVSIENSSGNTIGGSRTDEGNTLSENEFGIRIQGATGNANRNTLRHNRFDSNVGLPIDLQGDGETPNDARDLDVGPNGVLNRPDRLGIIQLGPETFQFRASLQYGHLTSFPVVIDFYSLTQGKNIERLLGTYSCENAGDCRVDEDTGTLDVAWAEVPGVVAGLQVIAMATDNQGNSSEFSNVAEVVMINADVVDHAYRLTDQIEGFLNIDADRNRSLDTKAEWGKVPDVIETSIDQFGEADYFRVVIPTELGQPIHNGTLIAELAFEHNDNNALSNPKKGDLDLQLFEERRLADGTITFNFRFESTGNSDRERIALPIIAEQINPDVVAFVLVVRGSLGDVNDHYDLNVELRADDVDSDGLPDQWEQINGIEYIEYDGTDGKVSFLREPPVVGIRDLFVEVDAMDGQEPRPMEQVREFAEQFPHLKSLLQVLDDQIEPEYPDLLTHTVLDFVVAAFYVGPCRTFDCDEENAPAGQRRILLHLELDEQDIPIQPLTTWDDFLAFRSNSFGTVAERNGWMDRPLGRLAKQNGYRYALFGDQLQDAQGLGRASIESNDFLIGLGSEELLDVGSELYGLYQASVFMHELGHTLGLHHGMDRQRNPAYQSVMNYDFLVPNDDPVLDTAWRLDYSSEVPFADWRELEFRFTYADTVRQGDTDFPTGACFGESEAVNAPTESAIRLLDIIDWPVKRFPGFNFERCLYGSDLTFEIEFPFDGIFALSISISDSEPNDTAFVMRSTFDGQNTENTVTKTTEFAHNFEVTNASEKEDARAMTFTMLGSGIRSVSPQNEKRFHITVDFDFARTSSNIDSMRELNPLPRPDVDADGVPDELDIGELITDFLQVRVGDVNTDGRVDYADFRLLAENFGVEDSTKSWGQGDLVGCLRLDRDCESELQGDGRVTRDDLDRLLSEWAVPENLYCTDGECGTAGKDDSTKTEIIDDFHNVMRSDANDNPLFDFDLNRKVDTHDRRILLDRMATKIGDSNFDGIFDSGDLVAVFQSGEYEDQVFGNSKWVTGDWNGDDEFNSSDLVVAFQEGEYEQGVLARPLRSAAARHAYSKALAVDAKLWETIVVDFEKKNKRNQFALSLS